MTFNVWAKINTIPVPNCMLFNAGSSPNGPDVFFENTAISWNIWDGSTTTFKNGGVNINSTTVVGNTSWHNYTFCVDAVSNNVKMYFGRRHPSSKTQPARSRPGFIFHGPSNPQTPWRPHAPTYRPWPHRSSKTSFACPTQPG